MKNDIHPDYHPVVFQDSGTGTKFLTRSTATSSRTVEWEDGQTYPLIVVDVTSESHPFWTGAQRHRRPRREGPASLRQPHPPQVSSGASAPRPPS